MSVMVVMTIFGVMLITMLTRVRIPFGQKPGGTQIKQVTLNFRQRLLYHRTSIYLLGTAMVLGGLGGWLSFAYQVIIVMAAFAIVGLRIRYTFTTEGVALNNVVYRAWDEFSAVESDSRVVRLVAKPGLRPFKIWLSAQQNPEIEQLAAKLVKHGGGLPIEPRPRMRPALASRPPKKNKALS